MLSDDWNMVLLLYMGREKQGESQIYGKIYRFKMPKDEIENSRERLIYGEILIKNDDIGESRQWEKSSKLIGLDPEVWLLLDQLYKYFSFVCTNTRRHKLPCNFHGFHRNSLKAGNFFVVTGSLDNYENRQNNMKESLFKDYISRISQPE